MHRYYLEPTPRIADAADATAEAPAPPVARAAAAAWPKMTLSAVKTSAAHTPLRPRLHHRGVTIWPASLVQCHGSIVRFTSMWAVGGMAVMG